MYTSVIAHIVKARMIRKTLVLRVLEDKYTALFQHLAPKDHIHHTLTPLKFIRRIREDHVVAV